MWAESTSGYMVNIYTSASSDPNVAFVSRMFAPEAGCPEDHVCGSAHCMMTPYWSKKLGTSGTQMQANQVSQRGGVLRVAWKQTEDVITLAGQAKIVARGELL